MADLVTGYFGRIPTIERISGHFEFSYMGDVLAVRVGCKLLFLLPQDVADIYVDLTAYPPGSYRLREVYSGHALNILRRAPNNNGGLQYFMLSPRSTKQWSDGAARIGRVVTQLHKHDCIDILDVEIPRLVAILKRWLDFIAPDWDK